MNSRINELLNNLECGALTFRPYIVMKDATEISLQYVLTVNEESKTVQMIAVHQGLFRDDLYIKYENDAFICRRKFQNISAQPLTIKELAVEIGGITYGLNPRDDYFYHNENPRIFGIMTFPVDYNRTAKDALDSSFDIQAGNRWADPGVICERVGAGPYQAFPAILLSNYQTKKGLVHGSLSQSVFFHNYLVEHVDGKMQLQIFSSFMDVDYLEMEPGRILTEEWYLGKTEEADDIERIFAGYTDVLREKLPVAYGRTNINRDNMIWGSWNDGVYRDVSEELILTEAKYLKENFPTVHWIQLDDGYSVYSKAAHGLGVPYEGETGIDQNKFPRGLSYLTDRIRQIGLRPALWIGGFCPKETLIYKEHPEWFMDYSHRVSRSSPLDVSQEEVRDYMCKALHVLCEQYGFDAVKHDFWSYAFEDRNDLYKNHNKSGYEYRTWWLKELRNVLPKDGYLQTGCDIVMGNPFLGEYFTNYRYGPDVGNGVWENLKTNYLWGIACFATHTGDLFVPNSDSVGIFPDLNDTDSMFCMNFCLVTHSMVEIAGLLSKTDKYDRLKKLKKAVCNPNNGQDIYFVRYDYRSHKQFAIPEIIYFKTPHFSKLMESELMPVRTVGVFNAEETEKEYFFSVSELGLAPGEYQLTDVWSGEQYEFSDCFERKLAPHESRLFAVNRKSGIQLYDANIRINSAQLVGNKLFLETDYTVKDAELFLSGSTVKEVWFEGQKQEFSVRENKVCLDIPGKGTLVIEL